MVKNRRTAAYYASYTFNQLLQTKKSAAIVVLSVNEPPFSKRLMLKLPRN